MNVGIFVPSMATLLIMEQNTVGQSWGTPTVKLRSYVIIAKAFKCFDVIEKLKNDFSMEIHSFLSTKFEAFEVSDEASESEDDEVEALRLS